MMPIFAPFEVTLIRHGATDARGKLCGRTDVDLATHQPEFGGVARHVAGAENVISSPARRCLVTAQLILPKCDPLTDSRLWEQDFGDWENRSYVDLPDIGDLDIAALAQHRPPNGESFLDVADRVAGVLEALDRDVVVFAHAGVIRVALGLALGDPALGLGFDVDHVSMTRLRVLGPSRMSIICANWTGA